MKNYMIFALCLMAASVSIASESIDVTSQTFLNYTNMFYDGNANTMKAYWMVQISENCKPSITATKNLDTGEYSYMSNGLSITSLRSDLFRLHLSCMIGQQRIVDPALVRLFKAKLDAARVR